MPRTFWQAWMLKWPRQPPWQTIWDTPFGHFAEEELSRLISDQPNIHEGFEGNAQTFQVITRLSVRHLDHPVQNLIRASLNAALKYRGSAVERGFKRRKYGPIRPNEMASILRGRSSQA
jgi:dGTP triphosphohydrolase